MQMKNYSFFECPGSKIEKLFVKINIRKTIGKLSRTEIVTEFATGSLAPQN